MYEIRDLLLEFHNLSGTQMSGPRTPIPLGVFIPDERGCNCRLKLLGVRRMFFRTEAVTLKFIKSVF